MNPAMNPVYSAGLICALGLVCWCGSEATAGSVTGTEDHDARGGAGESGRNREDTGSFWSFQAPRRHAAPSVRQSDWPRRPMDFFVLARLEHEGARPMPEAGRGTLARRVGFDLTGLPPEPEVLDAFLADERPDAYERLVERLLVSTRFGERMASLWLPLVRYAEDQAHQVGDDTTMAYPNAHLYREWVIDAFNRDLAYDTFLRLQLAADKVGAPKEDWPALGFVGLGPKYYNRNRLDVQADEWEDRVDTVTRVILGLTVACARCHDHKFDPIPMRDYYAMAGVFASTRMVNKSPAGELVPVSVKADKMSGDVLHIVEDGEPRDLPVFLRGNVERKGPMAERAFLRVLSSGESERFRDGSGRRELAERLSDSGNPLTARVMVNRLWAMCFGRPLVATASDFGHSGIQPTHPELLDDLAVRFMEDGWSIKALLREFVTSATYRQSSAVRDDGGVEDASNRWYGRMNRRRVTVEQWRDSILWLSGELTWARGRSLELDDPANKRRTVHARISRLKMNDLLMQFDYPDANVHAEKRSATTTATQKLFLLNNPFVLEQATAFARRLAVEVPESDRARVRHAFRLVAGREPDRFEESWALEYLAEPGTSGTTAWERFAQVLMVSNEMLYVD